MSWFCWYLYYWFRCFLRRVTAILLEQKNFGPNVIYYVFWESGGPSADEVDLEVDLKSTSGRPHANLRYLPAHLTHLPQVDLKSTSGRLGSLPRRHRSQCLQMTNGTWPRNKCSRSPPPFVGHLSHKLFRQLLKSRIFSFQSILACRGSQKIHFGDLGLT